MRYATRWLAGAVDNVRNVAQNAPARARATYTHHTHTQRGHTHTNRAHVCACVRAHTYGSSTGLMLRRGVHVHTTYVHTSRNGGHAHAHAYAHARRTQRESRGAAHVWDLCARLTIVYKSDKRTSARQMFLSMFDAGYQLLMQDKSIEGSHGSRLIFSSDKEHIFMRQRDDRALRSYDGIVL